MSMSSVKKKSFLFRVRNLRSSQMACHQPGSWFTTLGRLSALATFSCTWAAAISSTSASSRPLNTFANRKKAKVRRRTCISDHYRLTLGLLYSAENLSSHWKWNVSLEKNHFTTILWNKFKPLAVSSWTSFLDMWYFTPTSQQTQLTCGLCSFCI